MFKIYVELSRMCVEAESPNEGAWLRYMMNRKHHLSDEPESPNVGACLRYMLKRNRQMKGQFKIYDEPESPNEGACFRFLMIAT